MKVRVRQIGLFCFSGLTGLLLILYGMAVPQTVDTAAVQPLRRIHAPLFLDDDAAGDVAILWFGQVDGSRNYADARVVFYADALRVYLHIFDQWLWSAQTPDPTRLTEWDAASLYLHLDGPTGDAPTLASYRFVAQVTHWQPRDSYQRAYRGADGEWLPVATSFTTTSDWRGEGFNGAPARGWVASFAIPYSSLGLSGPPLVGTTWGMALAVHDRDDAAGTPLPDQTWPEEMDPQRPASWGELVAGVPTYSPPLLNPDGIATIRHGLDGVVVPDAHVGGHSTCGTEHDPDFFNGWGDANYAGYEQINIQNQWDVADWPCFSKYYITFPLETVPVARRIISATLTLHHFGNAFPAEAHPSYIQVMTVADDWDEGAITWNNAPLATENFSGAWVPVLPDFPGWPGVARQWDVSLPVIEAYEAGAPLRLVLYSADGDYHSGKYFYSSEAGEAGRPELRVAWSESGATPPTTTPVPTPPATTTPAPTAPPTTARASIYLPLVGSEP